MTEGVCGPTPSPTAQPLLATAAQLNLLLDESKAALEYAARERKGHRHRLAASELAVLREDVRGPGVGRSIARAKVEETAGPQDGEPTDVLAGVYEHIDKVTVGARVGPGDRRNPGAGIDPAEAVHGDVHRRRRRELIERDAQEPPVASPVQLVVDGQHVVCCSRGREEGHSARPARQGLEVTLAAHPDQDASGVVGLRDIDHDPGVRAVERIPHAGVGCRRAARRVQLSVIGVRGRAGGVEHLADPDGDQCGTGERVVGRRGGQRNRSGDPEGAEREG